MSNAITKILDPRTVRIGAGLRTPAAIADQGQVRIGAGLRRS